MYSRAYLSLELFLLFVLLPVSYLWDYPNWLKVGVTLIGFGYVLHHLKHQGALQFRTPSNSFWKPFWKETLIKLIIIVVVTIVYVYAIAPDKLFFVLLKKPQLWIMILFIYSIFSVWPQELIYRTYFFNRYESLLQNKRLFIFINAILFSLAHIFLKNTLVLVLTFLGGLLFAYTYNKTKSTALVSIEHAIYGNWLFSVGMGEMLAFPGVN